MKRFLFSLLMAWVLCPLMANVPQMTIYKTNGEEIQLPISQVVSIQYDKTSGTEMYVMTTSGKQTYLVAEVSKITLSDVPDATAIESVEAAEAVGAKKFLHNGVVYVVSDGKVFSVKGEKL